MHSDWLWRPVNEPANKVIIRWGWGVAQKERKRERERERERERKRVCVSLFLGDRTKITSAYTFNL